MNGTKLCQAGQNTQYIRWTGIWRSACLSRMTLREVVAKNLRRMRQAKGLSQEELADRAGINRNYVGMLEREEHAATVDMLEKLAEVLEIDPIEFLDRTK
jgi:ribosome-binding protein aMBF1 (putative translation factor)